MKQYKKVEKLEKFSLAVLKIPGSKSYTQRALLCASMCEDTSQIIMPILCEDVLLLKEALKKVGVDIETHNFGFSVKGTIFPALEGEVFFGNNGTGSRFFLAYACLGKGKGMKIYGVPRLHERPMGVLIEALRKLGANITCLEKEGFLPVVVRNGNIKKTSLKLPGNISSQFFSAIMLISPILENELEIYIEGELFSKSYIEITKEVMEAFSAKVIWEGNCIKIPYSPYKSTKFEIPADASSASYFLMIPFVLERGSVVIENYEYPSKQADTKFLEFLREMGGKVEIKGSKGVKVSFKEKLRGGEFNLKDCPDLFPTMCILCSVAEGKSILKGAPHLRYKETDRILAMAKELTKLGVKVEELPDGLIIEGRNSFNPAIIHTYDDHRIAMAFSILGLRTGEIVIENPDCVKKSFPDFWEYLDRLYEENR